ncbi:hypothetical protein P3X46_026093 [Hevea brasiliensis]|uniref:DUF569 domain-containing protein n=1 Tax=Hevea brasiliensis TaxID=3981 RepID=A0ABQ9KX56_HEVBR|nr:hypothetical protein P3X46_026093 [Hevea brasiliensis]
MEFFNKAKTVRLRSYHDKFLVADEDEETVRQDHDGSPSKACWTIEFVQSNSHLIRLKSSYGKYLSASNESFLLGLTGKKVMQIISATKKDITIDWEPRTEGFHVKLRTRAGTFLRANGGTPPWRNSVTHDVPHRSATQDWVLWKVDILGFDSIPGYLSSASSVSSSFSSDFAGSECSETESQSVYSVCSDRNALEEENNYAMELFQEAKVIRLRSHHDKFLLADDDQECVSQDRNGEVKNARWTVEIVEKANVVRLKSYYGKYLTASNMPFLLGMTGKKVLQSLPRRLDSSLEWQPIREGDLIKLKTRYGQYLRANAGLPPWRNHITHDIPRRSSTQDWILWDIDIVEIRRTDPPPQTATNRVDQRLYSQRPQLSNQAEVAPSKPGSPTAIWRTPPSFSRSELFYLQSDDSFVGVPMKNEGRLIHYSVANENGDFDVNKKLSFTFKGTEVEELKQRLKEETRLDDILVCSRNPLNGKHYPLRLNLPPNNAEMIIVVLPSSGKAASNIRHLRSSFAG